MNKKIICIGILGIFLFTSIGSAEIVFQNDSDDQDNQNVLNNELRVRYGKFYSNGHIEFIKDADFTGTWEIPHGSDVTVYCEYEIVDTLTPGELWDFRTNVHTTGSIPSHYDESKSLFLWDEFGDDSQTGTMEFTIPLEKFILGADEIHHWTDGFYKIPWLNYSDYCYTSGGIDVVLLNENPNTPSLPDGPTCLTARAGGTTKTATYTVDIPSDPDGDEIIKYKWITKDEDDDYWGRELIRDQPSIELEFHYNRLVGKQTYQLKVQVQDSYLTWSEWSEPLEITIRRVKSRTYETQFDLLKHLPLLYQFLYRLNLI